MSNDITPAEVEANGRRTLEQLAAVYTAFAEAVVDNVRDETGVDITPSRRPYIADATYGDLARLAEQAAAMTTAWDLIRKWIRPGETVRLGDRLKIVPVDVAQQIEAHLARARLT